MIWIILLTGFVLRLISLNQSLWLDEAINIQAAKSFSLVGMLTQYATADFHPPGWFATAWIWGKLFGYSEIAMRFPSVVFGIATIYVTYLIGKKLISKNVGLFAALFLSINPLHIYYSQEARMYSLATLAVTINILLIIKLIKGEKINLIFLMISNLGVLLSDYIAYFIFPAVFILFLLIKEKEVLKKWIMALTGALVLSIWWLPIFLSQLDVGATASSNLPTWKFVVGAFDFKSIPLTFIKFIIGRISLADKILYAALLIPVVSIFTYLLWKGVRNLAKLPRNLLLAWVIIPPLIATAVSIFIPVYSYFRVLFIIPGFMILVASGILYFKNRLRYIFLSFVVLIQIFCSLVYLLNPAYQREDWKGLVSFLNNVQPPIVLFESSGTLPPFDYYAKDELNAKGALKDFPARNESELADLGNLLKNYGEVYLIDYLVQISDPDRLVTKRLLSLGYKELDVKDFHGVGFVYHFVKND